MPPFFCLLGLLAIPNDPKTAKNLPKTGIFSELFNRLK